MNANCECDVCYECSSSLELFDVGNGPTLAATNLRFHTDAAASPEGLQNSNALAASKCCGTDSISDGTPDARANVFPASAVSV
jgi:hypothetical protein